MSLPPIGTVVALGPIAASGKNVAAMAPGQSGFADALAAALSQPEAGAEDASLPARALPVAALEIASPEASDLAAAAKPVDGSASPPLALGVAPIDADSAGEDLALVEAASWPLVPESLPSTTSVVSPAGDGSAAPPLADGRFVGQAPSTGLPPLTSDLAVSPRAIENAATEPVVDVPAVAWSPADPDQSDTDVAPRVSDPTAPSGTSALLLGPSVGETPAVSALASDAPAAPVMLAERGVESAIVGPGVGAIDPPSQTVGQLLSDLTAPSDPLLATAQGGAAPAPVASHGGPDLLTPSASNVVSDTPTPAPGESLRWDSPSAGNVLPGPPIGDAPSLVDPSVGYVVGASPSTQAAPAHIGVGGLPVAPVAPVAPVVSAASAGAIELAVLSGADVQVRSAESGGVSSVAQTKPLAGVAVAAPVARPDSSGLTTGTARGGTTNSAQWFQLPATSPALPPVLENPGHAWEMGLRYQVTTGVGARPIPGLSVPLQLFDGPIEAGGGERGGVAGLGEAGLAGARVDGVIRVAAAQQGTGAQTNVGAGLHDADLPEFEAPMPSRLEVRVTDGDRAIDLAVSRDGDSVAVELRAPRGVVEELRDLQSDVQASLEDGGFDLASYDAQENDDDGGASGREFSSSSGGSHSALPSSPTNSSSSGDRLLDRHA